MLANMKQMLADASRGGYAVGGFNCASLESAMGAIRASEMLGRPFVLQYAPVHGQYIPMEVARPIMLHLAGAAKTPVAVHLDHGSTIEVCLKALAMGFTSVMFDGSGLPFEENVRRTRFICETAHALGATVEAELGSMPHNYKDELVDYRPEDFYTRPEEAAAFVAETGVDALAISFGTVHGVYKATPKLSFSVVDAVREATKGLPLVMHGGSGLSADDYAEAVSRGICKINYYTYGAIAGGKAVWDLAHATPEGKLMLHGVAVRATEAVAEDIVHAMRLFAPGR